VTPRWTTPDTACGHRGCWDGWPEPWTTWANLVTGVRTVAAVALAIAAVATSRLDLLLVSLAVYWVGDVVDGQVARRLRQETRRGALLDVLTDRVCSVAFWVPWALWHPDVMWPVALYLLEFAVVDTVLSIAWLGFPLTSCNYVERVDRAVYRWNWWAPAKAVNTAGLVVLVVVWPQPLLASAFVLAVLAVKVASLRLLVRRLPGPGPGCAAASRHPEPSVLHSETPSGVRT